MKIALKVVIEMTPAQVADYCALNGIERSELRDDVRQHVSTTLQGDPDLGVEDGCTNDITVS